MIDFGFSRQRGFLGFSLMEIVIAVGGIALLLGAVYALLHFIDATWATSAGVSKGKAEESALYARRDNEALRAALAAKTAAEARVAALEAQNAADVTAAATTYQKGLKDGKANVDAAVARVHAGYRLRDPGVRAGCAPDGPRDSASQAVAGLSGRDGAAGSELSQSAAGVLSETASEFLVRLVGEADEVAKQLHAAQQIIIADRKVCGVN